MEQNLIRCYNEKHQNHAIGVWLNNDKNIKERQPKSTENSENRYFTYELNNSIELAEWKSDLNLLILLNNKKTYSAFDLLNEFKYDGRTFSTIYGIDLLINKEKIPYIRVASEYFKVLADKELIGFNKAEIRQDYGKEVFDFIRSYDKFGVFPNNINYKESVGNMLNTYHRPKNVAYDGDDFKGLDDERIKWSISMMKHIYGNQFELGLELVQILWCKPKQMLPITVLASVERQTGKTTFSNWMNDIFGDNHVSLGLEDMKNDFNHFFAEKLLITIEETQDESHKLVNKIKRISTTEKLLVNPKGVKQYVVDFYGKIFIMTNSPDSFLKVDSEEIRFWVNNIPTLQGKGNHNISEDLKEEIPFFLRLLQDMPIKEKRSRMWFHPDEIKTSGLAEVQKESKNSTQKELLYLLSNELTELAETRGVSEIYFNASDIKDRWFRSNNLVTRNYLHKLLITLRDEGIVYHSGKKISYTSHVGEMENNRVGQCFWFEVENEKLDDAVDNLDNNDLPF